MQHLEGLIAAPPTPMHPDGAVDLDRVGPLCRMLKANGVRGAFVCGTTGEGPSLTADERRAVAAEWTASADADFAVIVQVGHDCLPVATDLAAHAQEVGADAIAAMPPTFFKPDDPDDLLAYCEQVASAAPRLPFYYYHIPHMSGVRLPVAELLSAGGEQVPTLRGAKFTSDDLMDFSRCLEVDGGRYDMLFGRDQV
ncbi:MAG: dihydrodipicolinate synthase family protein, partial [Planctomycetota bacterium]